MSKNAPNRSSSVLRMMEKFALSAFVVLSFIAYGLHERFSSTDAAANALPPTPEGATGQPAISRNAPANAPTQTAPIPPTAPSAAQAAPAPTLAPSAPTAKAQGLYKDGTYTGPQTDTFYGPVQVQAVVQNGKLARVQFLQYPNDRRTSVRINQTVMPWLQSEAIQAQNANVDVVTGATLTSEAFIQSLQAALGSARSGS